MVFKVAKELQPSVIYIDEAEKLWVSSKARHVSSLARLRKSLAIQRAALAPTDRVLIVGNSRQPFHEKTDLAELQEFFGYQNQARMLYTPCPNHHTRLQLWRTFIERTGLTVAQLSQSAKFDLSTLAFITEGYSAGSILHAVQYTLPPRRVEKLLESGRSIDMSELLSSLSKTNYMYQEEYAAFANFTFVATGEQERLRMLVDAIEKEREAKAANSKKKPRK